MRISDWSSDVCSSDLAAIDETLVYALVAPANQDGPVRAEKPLGARLIETAPRRTHQNNRGLRGIAADGRALFAGRPHCLFKRLGHHHHPRPAAIRAVVPRAVDVVRVVPRVPDRHGPDAR